MDAQARPTYQQSIKIVKPCEAWQRRLLISRFYDINGDVGEMGFDGLCVNLRACHKTLLFRPFATFLMIALHQKQVFFIRHNALFVMML